VVHETSKGKVLPGDIQEWIKLRVAKHKFLTGGVVFVDEVPKLASGKIQRKVMREWAKRDALELEKRSWPRL
jgi:4-coumarate--CoA ligase